MNQLEPDELGRKATPYAPASPYAQGMENPDQPATTSGPTAREQHLSVIFDTMTDVAFVVSVEAEGQYRFVFVNKAFATTTGLPAERVVGRYVHEVIPEPSLTLVLGNYAKAIAAKERVVWLEVSDYPTGRVTGEVSATPVFDSAGHCTQLVGLVHDLTAQKHTEEELRSSNERFQYALKATTDALYDWNIAADTLYWGEGYEGLFGYQLTHNPTPFSYWADHVHPDEHERVVAGLRQTAYETTGSFWQQEYRFGRADGSWAVVFDRGYIVRDEQGRPVRMIGAMQDITARKAAEEQLRLLAEQLVRQNTYLQQCAYIISHDLRAPLANALGFTDLLSRIDKNSDVFDTSLKNLRTSVQRFDDVLTDVNTILSIRNHPNAARPAPVAVADVCAHAVLHAQPELRACGGLVECFVPDAVQLRGSRAYLHSIFDNLIGNAIKYRAAGRPLRIAITGQSDADGVTITVSDNGSGFDQEQAGDDIFQLYRRFHTDKQGRGIGLFLVKAHVESMYGQISVRSRVNEGTQFILYFRHHDDENLSD